MTVFITQEPRPHPDGKWVGSLSSAGQYGACKYVFELNFNVFLDPAKSQKIALEILKDFDPRTDYILDAPRTGFAPSRACIMALLSMGIEEITFLDFDRAKTSDGKRDSFEGIYLPKRWILQYKGS